MPRRESFRLAALGIGALLGLGLGVAGWLGSPAVEIVEPSAPARVETGGVAVLVRFPGGRVRAATFRALLNGADVSGQLTIASNGAYGTVYGLLDGENLLELAVFAGGPWRPHVLVEEVHTFRVVSRPPLDWNRG